MSTPTTPNNEKEREKVRAIPTASAVLPDGELVELVYDPVERSTQFVRGKAMRDYRALLLSSNETPPAANDVVNGTAGQMKKKI